MTLLDHLSRGMLIAEHGALYIDVEDFIPLLLVHCSFIERIRNGQY